MDGWRHGHTKQDFRFQYNDKVNSPLLQKSNKHKRPDSDAVSRTNWPKAPASISFYIEICKWILQTYTTHCSSNHRNFKSSASTFFPKHHKCFSCESRMLICSSTTNHVCVFVCVHTCLNEYMRAHIMRLLLYIRSPRAPRRSRGDDTYSEGRMSIRHSLGNGDVDGARLCRQCVLVLVLARIQSGNTSLLSRAQTYIYKSRFGFSRTQTIATKCDRRNIYSMYIKQRPIRVY